MKTKEWTDEELAKFKLVNCRFCKSKPTWFHNLNGEFRLFCRKCHDEHLLVMTEGSRNPVDVVKAWNKEI